MRSVKTFRNILMQVSQVFSFRTYSFLTRNCNTLRVSLWYDHTPQTGLSWGSRVEVSDFFFDLNNFIITDALKHKKFFAICSPGSYNARDVISYWILKLVIFRRFLFFFHIFLLNSFTCTYSLFGIYILITLFM